MSLTEFAHVPEFATAVRRAAHRLALTLAKTEGVSACCETIVQAMAKSTQARLASIALADADDRRLSIRATFGYPLLLVEHLRIESGAGVYGTVFQSGKLLHVRDARSLPGRAQRRHRYRSDSFIAVPITHGEEVLAVVCIADREDNRPFTRRDLSMVRALAAPAALALARERAVARAELYAHAAAIDPVSGLFNRRYFHVRIEEELQRSRRHQIPLALLMADLDDFKSVNDSFGHLVGDAVIRETAEILRQSVRVFDVCTRFGGEEFAIIMPGSAIENAAKIAERIRERVEHYRPVERSLQGLAITLSIGLAVSSADMSTRDLIGRADQALYHAKRSGKNCVHILDSSK